MKRTFFCLLLQGNMYLLSAQQALPSLNPLQSSSGTYTAHQFNAFSFGANQAALANATTFALGLYGEHRFMLQDLGWYQLAVVLPTSGGNFGVKGTYFGNAVSSAKELGLAYGRSLGKKLALGAQFNYYSQNIAQYGAVNILTIEGGILLNVTDQLKTGFHVYNLINTPLGKTDEALPSIYTVGLGYEPSEQFGLTAEVQKVANETVNIKAHVYYQFDKKLVAKAGLTSNNAVYSLALGIQLAVIRLEPTVFLHPQLGLTPGLTLFLHKKEKAL